MKQTDHVVYITFKIKGFIDDFHILHDEQLKQEQRCSITTVSIEFSKLINLIACIRTEQGNYFDNAEMKFKTDLDQKKDSLNELYALLGIDLSLMNDSYGTVVMHPKITKALVQFYRIPKISEAEQQPRLPNFYNSEQNSNFDDLCYKACMSLYSISRARIQYLGASIPLFRFKHSLFEALISAIHEREIRPNYFEDYNYADASILLQEPISHEKFLIKKYLEFMNHTYLKQLLVLSYSGDSLKFVEYFNSL